ncbi:MAG: hypothetical protein JKY30_06385, partial [Flavobacteriales bacterium]|nr:hypothetical protein [Flavobacteriales bacterium]
MMTLYLISLPIKKYNRVEKIIKEEDLSKKTDSFWDEARPDTLTEQEAGVYFMIDSIQKIPTFKRFMNIASLLISGWKTVGPIEIGPLPALYSFNDVEGFRQVELLVRGLAVGELESMDLSGDFSFEDGFVHSPRIELSSPSNRLILSQLELPIALGRPIEQLRHGRFDLEINARNLPRLLGRTESSPELGQHRLELFMALDRGTARIQRGQFTTEGGVMTIESGT